MTVASEGDALGRGVSSIALVCAPPNLYPHLGGFSLPLVFFTSRCLTRDLPTFHVREAHKNPGGFNVKGGPRPGSREQGKDRRQREGYRIRKGQDPWLLFLYLSELLCPAEGTTCNRENRHFWSGTRAA